MYRRVRNRTRLYLLCTLFDYSLLSVNFFSDIRLYCVLYRCIPYVYASIIYMMGIYGRALFSRMSTALFLS